jgi:hypothetical protein
LTTMTQDKRKKIKNKTDGVWCQESKKH